MPVQSCQVDGKPGFRWGDSGKCYTYTADNESSKENARQKALEQGRAIQVNKDKQVNIVKVDPENNLVFGWAYIAKEKDGTQVTDHSGQYVEDVEALEIAAYAFNLGFRKSGEVHVGESKGHLVESMMFTKEKMAKLGLPEDALPQGLWVGFYFPDDAVFEKVKSGQYKMFSIQGRAIEEVV